MIRLSTLQVFSITDTHSLLQGKAHLKGYDPNYFHVKSLAYLKGNEAAATVIILLPPKQL